MNARFAPNKIRPARPVNVRMSDEGAGVAGSDAAEMVIVQLLVAAADAASTTLEV